MLTTQNAKFNPSPKYGPTHSDFSITKKKKFKLTKAKLNIAKQDTSYLKMFTGRVLQMRTALRRCRLSPAAQFGQLSAAERQLVR